ncbi:MAG: hypothetical protein GX596_03775 [Propionibacterium sp.]|nr:hypothetical protein [Propionibacterium sp.]
MRLLSVIAAAALLLAGCTGDDPAPAPETPEPGTPAATQPAVDEPPMPNEPSVVETMNTEKAWDDWGVDDPLPEPGPEMSLVQLIRMDFTDPDAIDAHVRLGLPADLLAAPEGEEITFCAQADTEAVGFGAGWSVERSERDGYVVCDTTGTFGIDDWGDDALVAKPVLTDGVWDVDFQQAFMPEATVVLYRFRMEFGGPVLEASEGGEIDDTAVTWNGPAAISATAEAGN